MERNPFPVQSHTAPPGKHEALTVLGWEEQSAATGSPKPRLVALQTQWLFLPTPPPELAMTSSQPSFW